MSILDVDYSVLEAKVLEKLTVCGDTLEVGGEAFRCCLKRGHKGSHMDDSKSSWGDNPVLRKYAYYNLFGRLYYRTGVDNWTEVDFIESARRSRLLREVHTARVSAMESLGWVMKKPYCSQDTGYAVDPLTQEVISHDEAYLRQEARKPGSVPPWPTFDNKWKPPASSGLIDLDLPTTSSMIPIMEIKSRRFDLIDPSMVRSRARECTEKDQAVFDALDSIYDNCNRSS